MTKSEFIDTLNTFCKDSNKEGAIIFMSTATKLSLGLSRKTIESIWSCSDPNYFGNNLFDLLETSANSDNAVQFEPKLKTTNCSIYIMYLDEHTAAFALYKINKL